MTINVMTINRRELLFGFAGATACATFSTLSFSQGPATDLRINADRLRQSLEGLSTYGRPTGGTFADGVSRTGFSDLIVVGRKYVMQLMHDAGMEPRIDAAGNIFGSRAGSDHNLKPILFGSHIDSVPSGGNFDGDLGSLSAIEIIRTLNEHHVTTRHPLQTAIWTDEEGTFVGSGSAAGRFQASDLNRVRDEMSIADGLRKLGGDPTRLAEARLAPGAFRCYLELHIEQGATLYKTNIPIGVVEGIVAIDRYDVEIRGFANHAGTTPMKERHNALLAAAKLIEVVQDVVTREPGRQVGTVGKVEVFPNAVNVIPGLVKHSIELRDLSVEKIARLGDEIRKRAHEIARETGTEITLTKTEHDAPAEASSEMQAKIEDAAKGLGLKTMRLASGAGQDAQMLARVCPMGMIFVPSVDGISHSPKEFTRWEDCSNGANVLLHTILAIDSAA
jgi:beta-ureidopropionase / N-carbamoyl-L-amino-acid hydrolase